MCLDCGLTLTIQLQPNEIKRAKRAYIRDVSESQLKFR